jgi:hypothetical protein
MLCNAPKRSVSYAPGTKTPEDKRIKSVPQAVEWLRAVVWLRKCKVFVPAQLFDLINLRLTPTYCPNHNCQVSLFHQHVYTQPPYTALIHDLAYVNSFPLTLQIIAEIQEMRTGPSAPHPTNTFQSPMNRSIGPELNAMNLQFIAAQRQFDQGAEKSRSVPKSNLPQTQDDSFEQTDKLNRKIYEQAQKTRDEAFEQAEILNRKLQQQAQQRLEKAQKDLEATLWDRIDLLGQHELLRLQEEYRRANVDSYTAR